MSNPYPPGELRRGVIVIHPFGSYDEGQFVDDPAEIEQLIEDGHSWRVVDAVMLAPAPEDELAPVR